MKEESRKRILDAIGRGASNDEIRSEIHGRLTDETIDALRAQKTGGDEEVNREIEAAVMDIFAGTGAGTPDGNTESGLAEGKSETPDRVEPANETPAKKPTRKMRLRVKGVDMSGLLSYYVDASAITIEADCVEIYPEDLDELQAELAKVIEKHRKMAEKGVSEK